MIKVSCPATTANMGPGFDCLGAAIELRNHVLVTLSSNDQPHLTITVEGYSEKIPLDETNIIVEAARLAYSKLGKIDFPSCHFHLVNNIPLGRGLGSSSASIVCGLTVGYLLANATADAEAIYQLAASMEGHADNVAPAIFGGVQLAYKTSTNDGWKWQNRSISIHPTVKSLDWCFFVPDRIAYTKDSRSVLSCEVDRNDAVFNISRASLLIHALEGGHLEDLKVATEDAIHQTKRSTLFRYLPYLATESKSRACWLSGAGSSVAILSNPSDQLQIKAVALQAGLKYDEKYQLLVSSLTPIGLTWSLV